MYNDIEPDDLMVCNDKDDIEPDDLMVCNDKSVFDINYSLADIEWLVENVLMPGGVK